jgi:hypothetical protein
MTIENINKLKSQYEEAGSKLRFPLSVAELYEITERRKETLEEARAIAKNLNLDGDHWFSPRP